MRCHHVESNWVTRRPLTSLVASVLLIGAGGLWLWLACGAGGAALPGAAALSVAALVGVVWGSRARATRRFNAAVDAYAQREINRERRRGKPQGSTGRLRPGGGPFAGGDEDRARDSARLAP
jgi:hypothetical protein